MLASRIHLLSKKKKELRGSEERESGKKARLKPKKPGRIVTNSRKGGGEGEQKEFRGREKGGSITPPTLNW